MSEELVITDVDGICRLCLKGDGTIIPIFGRENTSRDCIPLSKKILDCVSIKVFDGDGLPHMICVGCVHQVDSWHGFKNNCDSSQKRLNAWLQKTNPEIFAKNDVENKQKNKPERYEPCAQSSPVIDLSSDDDDIIFTHQPVLRRTLGSSGRRSRNRPRSRLQNIEMISLGTNEVEILPVDDVCVKKKGTNQLEPEIIPSTSSSSGLPDVVTATNTDFTAVIDPTDHHILPHSAPAFESSNSHNINAKEDVATKEIEPKKTLCSNGTDLNQEPVGEDSNEHSNPIVIEQVQVNECEPQAGSANHSSESQEIDVSIENTMDSMTENQDPLEMQDPESTNGSQLDCIAESINIEGIEPLDKSLPGNERDGESRNSLVTDDNSNAADKTITDQLLHLEKPNEEPQENSNSHDSSSSLVIEKVTSLTNHDCERMDDGNKSQEEDNDVEYLEEGNSQDDDSSDLQLDIVMCDTSMNEVVNIKDEPLSASEATGDDEEDPLNFQAVLIKREPEDYLSETEDVKPNVRQLNEAMENHYAPKKLKSGKIQCEPCRVSFLNDVYYERHAKSLRHRLNYKLYRSGKAPTRKRGKSLIQAIMGNNSGDLLRPKGPFYCNQCPSGFKHIRNLKTHQKKHLVEASVDRRSDLNKPPIRLSAQNVKFVTADDTKCDLCNQTFATFPALVSHKRFCGKSVNRVCNYCHQNFSTISLFLRHRKECLKLYRRQSLNITQQQQQLTTANNIPSPASTITQVPTLPPLDGSVLACTLCNLTFQSSPDLISHMQQNHMDFGKPASPIEMPNFAKPNHFSQTKDSSLHYCKYCFRSFPLHSALSSHTGYHARKNVYCCKFCKQSFRDKLTFRQHMKVHISDPNLNKNVCWICYTPFSTQKDLIDHKNVHVNMKMKIFSCGICGNSYNTKELLSRHRKVSHNTGPGQPYREFDNDQRTDFSEDVSVHEAKVVLIDEDNKLFKCKICKKRFSSIGNLKRHGMIHKRPMVNLDSFVSTNTEQSHQNRCNWCFRNFKTQSGLLNHRPVCTRVKTSSVANTNVMHGIVGKPVRCKGCKKWFASQNSLYKHRVHNRCMSQKTNEVIVTQLNPQNCPNCDQQFLSEESLNRHKQHCKPSIERLTCDCGEVFSSVEQKLGHSESCPANCTCKTCNIKFNSPEELESHGSVCAQPQPQPQHTAVQPSSFTENRLPPAICQKCNKRFVYTKCLQIHQDKCLYDRWPCTNCMEIFPTETALATHKSHKICKSPRLNRSPSVPSLQESPAFKCEFCLVKFSSAYELQQHAHSCDSRPSLSRRRDLASAYRPFTCEFCSKTFLWKANLIRHQKMAHRELLSTTINEPLVQKTASSPRSESPVSSHSQRESSYFICPKCPEIIFHKQQGFLEHQMMHERQEGKRKDNEDEDRSSVMLTCELCDRKLPESLYPMHMDEHMNDDFEESQTSKTPDSSQAEYPCDICGKAFHSPVSRNSHRAIHYRGGNELAHLAHKRSPKKKKFKAKHVRCATCNKLLSINSMPKHKMMHVREAAEFYGDNQTSSQSKSTPVINTPRSVTPNLTVDLSSSPEANEDETSAIFPCPKCEKSFKLRKLLLEHLKGHQDECFETESTTSSTTGPADQFQYKCVYCDLSWKFKSVYERHMSSKKHMEIQKQLSGII